MIRSTYTIWKKEMRSYLVSPLAYVFLGTFLMLAGLFFYLGVTLTGEASLRVLLANLAVTQLFILPMLTMRHFAEERRQGTLELLFTAPVSLDSAVIIVRGDNITLDFAGSVLEGAGAGSDPAGVGRRRSNDR